MTSASLLASRIRLPARGRRKRRREPGRADDRRHARCRPRPAWRRHRVRLRRRRLRWAVRHRAARARARAPASASRIAATRGRCRRQSVAQLVRRRGSRPSADDLEALRMARDHVERRRPDRARRAEQAHAMRLHARKYCGEQRRGRHRRQQRIDAIENTAMSGQQVAAVLRRLHGASPTIRTDRPRSTESRSPAQARPRQRRQRWRQLPGIAGTCRERHQRERIDGDCSEPAVDAFPASCRD